MNDAEYKNYRAEQSLAQCGFSPESIDSIKSTRVVTHNGTQHVIRNEQSHLFGQTEVSEGNSLNQVDRRLAEQFAVHQQQFARFKQYADNRIMQLESQMTRVVDQLKTATEIINTLKSNSQAAANRAKLSQGADKAPVTQAIDRNNVAPADVSIEKMFYYGNT